MPLLPIWVPEAKTVKPFPVFENAVDQILNVYHSSPLYSGNRIILLALAGVVNSWLPS